MSNDFHKRVLELNCGTAEATKMMRDLWAPTPFMVEAWNGHRNDQREREMFDWCFKTFGPESSPLHGKQGRWRRGGAPNYSWGWWGFSTLAELDQFMARWPTPEGIEVPV